MCVTAKSNCLHWFAWSQISVKQQYTYYTCMFRNTGARKLCKIPATPHCKQYITQHTPHISYRTSTLHSVYLSEPAHSWQSQILNPYLPWGNSRTPISTNSLLLHLSFPINSSTLSAIFFPSHFYILVNSFISCMHELNHISTVSTLLNG